MTQKSYTNPSSQFSCPTMAAQFKPMAEEKAAPERAIFPIEDTRGRYSKEERSRLRCSILPNAILSKRKLQTWSTLRTGFWHSWTGQVMPVKSPPTWTALTSGMLLRLQTRRSRGINSFTVISLKPFAHPWVGFILIIQAWSILGMTRKISGLRNMLSGKDFKIWYRNISYEINNMEMNFKKF